MKLTKYALFIPFILSVLFVTGCDSAKNASKSNFKKVINLALKEECIKINAQVMMFGDQSFPVTIKETLPSEYFMSAKKAEETNTRKLAPFNALTKVGLLTVKNEQIEEDNQIIQTYTFTLTDKGKKYLFKPDNTIFCIGHYTVDEITDFTEPGNSGGVTVSLVNYIASPTNVPDWVNTEEIKMAFPQLDKLLAQKQEERARLILKNDGWAMYKGLF